MKPLTPCNAQYRFFVTFRGADSRQGVQTLLSRIAKVCFRLGSRKVRVSHIIETDTGNTIICDGVSIHVSFEGRVRRIVWPAMTPMLVGQMVPNAASSRSFCTQYAPGAQ